MGTSRSSPPIGRIRATIDVGVHLQVGLLDQAPVVWLEGELDAATADWVHDGLILTWADPDEPVVVDVSTLRFIDARGLAALVAVHERMTAAGAPGLVVRGADAIVLRVFELADATALLEAAPPAAVMCGATDTDRTDLEAARREIGMSTIDLFLGYVALGGTASHGALRAHLEGRGDGLDRFQHDIVVHVVNETLLDRPEHDRRLAYATR